MPSMEPASTSSDSPEPRKARKPGPWPPKIEPFVPNSEHNPRELKSWAKRTGFNPNFSGETQASISENGENDAGLDLGFSDKDGRIQLEKREGGKDGKELASGFGFARKRKESENRGIEIEPVVGSRGGVQDNARKRNGLENKGIEIEPMAGSRDGVRRSGMENRGIGVVPGLGVRNGENEKEKEVPGFVSKRESEVAKVVPVDGGGEVDKEVGKVEGDVEIDVVSESREGDDSVLQGRPGMKYGLGDRHGIVPLIFYGMQHYLSLAGSLVLIPLVIVPAMGGTDKETATVISTMLLVSGVTTILHSYFGTRLPLVQGSSFVYLAPALVIANSREFRDLNGNKFKHIMRELQGAVIIGSIFQCILGYSGLMSFLLRLINPVVVASTVAAVGLAFFSYGFPQAGSCVEISIPQILLVLIFSLYLRRVSIFGQRIFQVYAVPLSVAIIWSYAFLLTESGAYNYKGCNPNIPSSNILLDACRRHAYTMKHCRTDVSNAWKSADWVRVPYPFQWGMPTFRLRTSIMMILVSVVATVDSVGLYHSVTLLVGSRVLTPGIVSRGIGLEGFTSILAGIWGTGTGSTTLIENIHTIAVTKMGSRRAVELGAVLLILFSFIGKIGALLASIPQALAASALCYIWGLVVALGLSTLRYCETASSRNAIIMGLSLFLSLSVPAYFQQYQPLSSFVLPSYYVPYAAASDGPVHIGNKALDYAINGLLSLNMVVAFLVAMILDNTVPGSKQERGVYIWSSNDDVRTDPSFLGDYSLPQRVAKFFRCVKCVGI